MNSLLKIMYVCLSGVFIPVITTQAVSQTVSQQWHSNPYRQPFKDYESKDLKCQGVDGVWFPELMANEILLDLENYDLAVQELKVLNRKIMLLSSQSDLRLQRIEDLKMALSLSKEIEVKLENTLKLSEDSRLTAEERAIIAEKHAYIWYRHPILWLTIGVALTSVAGGLVLTAIN